MYSGFHLCQMAFIHYNIVSKAYSGVASRGRVNSAATWSALPSVACFLALVGPVAQAIPCPWSTPSLSDGTMCMLFWVNTPWLLKALHTVIVECFTYPTCVPPHIKCVYMPKNWCVCISMPKKCAYLCKRNDVYIYAKEMELHIFFIYTCILQSIFF